MILLPRLLCVAAQRTAAASVRYDLVPLQRGLCGCPWRVAMASVLLNRTTHVQARRALHSVLDRWPTPELLGREDPWKVSPYIRSCGFVEKQTKDVVALSRLWLTDDWTDVRDLPGASPYVTDAVGLFCFGCLDLVTTDHALMRWRDYLNTARTADASSPLSSA